MQKRLRLLRVKTLTLLNMKIITKNGFRFLYPENGKYLKNGDIITDYVALGASARDDDWQEIDEAE